MSPQKPLPPKGPRRFGVGDVVAYFRHRVKFRKPGEVPQGHQTVVDVDDDHGEWRVRLEGQVYYRTEDTCVLVVGSCEGCNERILETDKYGQDRDGIIACEECSVGWEPEPELCGHRGPNDARCSLKYEHDGEVHEGEGTIKGCGRSTISITALFLWQILPGEEPRAWQIEILDVRNQDATDPEHKP